MLKIVIDFGAFWARFWVPLGVPFGSSWRPLGVPFGVPKRAYLEDALGTPLGGVLEASWEPPGGLLGCLRGLLGASWDLLEAFWSLLGASEGIFQRKLRKAKLSLATVS